MRPIRASSLPVLALVLVPSLSAQIVFEPPTLQQLSHRTQGVLSADVNADGHADLVSLPRYEQGFIKPHVSVLFGHGDGSFDAPIVNTLPTVDCSRGCAVDLNGDPFPDLALSFVTSGSNGITLMYGNGDGTFTAGQGYPVPGGFLGGAVTDILASDLTSDGLLDFVLVESGGPFFGGRITTLVAQGGDRYVLMPGSALPNATKHGAVGDINGDGRPDVVASNSSSGTLSLLAGLGDGHFAPAVPLPVGGSPGGLVLADFDGDDLLDLAVADTTGNRLLLLAGLGAGHFAVPDDVAVGSAPEFLSAGLLDDDGELDLIVSDKGSGELSVLRGAGDGTFALVATVSHIPLAVGSALGDFDEDGVLDAAVGTQVPDGLASADGIVVLRNHTYAALSPFTDLGHAFPGTSGYPIHLADGTLQAGTPVSFRLLNALPGGSGTLFVGFSQLDAPFKGGTLVPFPNLVFLPLPLGGAGATTLTATWPASVASGFAFYLQFGFKDLGALNGYALSNAVRVITP